VLSSFRVFVINPDWHCTFGRSGLGGFPQFFKFAQIIHQPLDAVIQRFHDAGLGFQPIWKGILEYFGTLFG
jgi:hypothetical protein